MRITDVPPDSDPSVSNTDDSNVQQEKDESAFAKMLAKRREASQIENQPQGTAKKQSDVNSGTVDPMLQQPVAFQGSIQPSAVEAKHIVAVPPELQQLVKEISVAVNSAGNHQVNIEMNSNVLKGLHIRIERGDAGMTIQFQSTSDQVSALLQNNMPALSQGLADRGVRVSDIRVTATRDASRSRDTRNRPYPGSQAGRQGRGR